MATEVSAAPMALPQLQSVQKAMAIPTVGAAVGQVGALYTRVKDAHSLFEWALSTAEAGVTLAAHTAAPFVSAPLAVADAKMAGYIDALERKAPLVNEQPQVIVETTKKAVLSKISPHVNKMATEVSAAPMALPQLQSVQKAMAIPTVGAAVGQVGALYTRVKDAHSLFEWALSTAEAGVTLAAHIATPFVSAPLAVADAKMAGYIDALERKVPLVNEQPQVIVETTKKAVLSKISPHVNKVMGCRVAAEQRVKSLKDLSWAKANALLGTACGQKALIGVDSGATYVMQLLDHYLPAVRPQEESVEIVAATNDPALHTMQTVGRLSAVAARRVRANLTYKVNELGQSCIDFHVIRYLKALLAALGMGCRVAAEQRVKSLKYLSWAKANALLGTAYGQKALMGVDSGATYAMQLLDHYLPAVRPQEESVEIVAATNDPALHTMQTVGRLSAVAAHRVRANLAYKINELEQSGIDFVVTRYLKARLADLQPFLFFIVLFLFFFNVWW